MTLYIPPAWPPSSRRHDGVLRRHPVTGYEGQVREKARHLLQTCQGSWHDAERQSKLLRTLEPSNIPSGPQRRSPSTCDTRREGRRSGRLRKTLFPNSINRSNSSVILMTFFLTGRRSRGASRRVGGTVTIGLQASRNSRRSSPTLTAESSQSCSPRALVG